MSKRYNNQGAYGGAPNPYAQQDDGYSGGGYGGGRQANNGYGGGNGYGTRSIETSDDNNKAHGD